MSATIIDGKATAAELRQTIKADVSKRIEQGLRQPGLAVVLVGSDPASQVYVGHKRKACAETGVLSKAFDLAEDTTQDDLLALIEQLNNDDEVDGILVQLPLPDHLNEDAIITAISPYKDVDGFHPYNIGRLVQRKPILRPCTPFGCAYLLEQTGETIAGKDAVVLGQSNIVGRPMAMELLMMGATVTICHSKTKDLADKIRHADIVVAAVGIPEMVQGDWIKKGAIVIDVGINRLDSGERAGKLVGDVDYASAAQHASYITPVPGGVGPMTIAMLLKNTLQAAEYRD